MEKIKLLLFVEFVAMLVCVIADVFMYITECNQIGIYEYGIIAGIAFLCWLLCVLIIIPVAEFIFNL